MFLTEYIFSLSFKYLIPNFFIGLTLPSGIDGSYPEHYGVPEDEAEEFVNTAAQGTFLYTPFLKRSEKAFFAAHRFQMVVLFFFSFSLSLAIVNEYKENLRREAQAAWEAEARSS